MRRVLDWTRRRRPAAGSVSSTASLRKDSQSADDADLLLSAARVVGLLGVRDVQARRLVSRLRLVELHYGRQITGNSKTGVGNYR